MKTISLLFSVNFTILFFGQTFAQNSNSEKINFEFKENLNLNYTIPETRKFDKQELINYLKLEQVSSSIDTSDTVVFDLYKANIIGNQIEFPVTFHSDDYVYAMDFELKYNNQNIEFDTLINLTNGLNYLYYLNPNDSTLRFTSYRLGQMQNDSTVILLRFSSFTGNLCTNDLNSIKGYLNGDQCSHKVTDCDTTTTFTQIPNPASQIEIYPIPAADKLFINAMENCQIEIIDSKGDFCLSTEYIIPHSGEPLDISQFKRGIYFIRITSEKYSIAKKIVILN
ncbi:MAG TPA: T9SS type A sorting domain-containing protein [Bacteroidia bacterium]|nr:T9SS type A sorting domain-containing protein [Bacteroidia bacterium]